MQLSHELLAARNAIILAAFFSTPGCYQFCRNYYLFCDAAWEEKVKLD
jgi:hypothetical protein